MADTIQALLTERRGHFKMESGLHSGSWFELDTLFDRPEELRSFVTELARRLAAHHPDAVCGPETGGASLARLIADELLVDCLVAERTIPLRYALPQAQRERARGRAVAIVDDAISAGSAVRGTYADLLACGARPIALGALMLFGDGPSRFAAETGLPLEGIERIAFAMWPPADCPLCRSGVALTDA